jgi:KaiC/GvpD/RAD55 family RecA-like ATPase
MVRNRFLSASALAPAEGAVDRSAAVDRTTSGIPGLDVLIDGGFPSRRTIAICGATGTGKTAFGLQFLAAGADCQEPGIFVTVDAKPQHLIDDSAALDFDLDGLIRTGSIAILDASPYFTATRGQGARGGVDPRQVASDLAQHVRRMGARRLVIDSLSSLVPSALSRAEAYDYLRSLIRSLEDNLECTILLTCRPSRLDPQESCDAIRSLASGVVDLALRRRGNDLVRIIRVRKMRGTPLDLAEHRLAMEPAGGLAVGPADAAGTLPVFRPRPRPVAAEAPQPSDRPEAV